LGDSNCKLTLAVPWPKTFDTFFKVTTDAEKPLNLLNGLR
jgi:hypothetical protein